MQIIDINGKTTSLLSITVHSEMWLPINIYKHFLHFDEVNNNKWNRSSAPVNCEYNSKLVADNNQRFTLDFIWF